MDCITDNLMSEDLVSLAEIFNSQEIDNLWKQSKAEMDMFKIPDGTGGVNPGDRRAVYYLISKFKPKSAIYLAAPEVENDRRALNTLQGMRRARKEGRLMGVAPFGYINRSKEDGKKFVATREPQASAIRWAFNEIAKGIHPVNQIRLKMNASYQTKIGRSAFHVAIRNPCYYGKVFVAKYQDEEAHLVQGQHEALVSKELFEKVQSIIDGFKNNVRPNIKIITDSNLPLRGFLSYPECGRVLTGSASSGRTKRYYYYHCASPCAYRNRAELANDIFESILHNFKLNKTAYGIAKKLLLTNYKKFVQNPYDIKTNRNFRRKISKGWS
jgi:site-specific DNA recombinase